MYEGETKDGQPHGQGTLTLDDGTKYVGEWKNGEEHGQGTLIFSDGDKYVGEWKGGQRHGQGTFLFADGDKYVGEFKDDHFHGEGTYSFASVGEYIGEWKDGERHGKGTLTLDDGGEYVGEFKDGNFHGAGKITGSDRVFEGEFSEGKRSGTGVETWSDGLRVGGQWINDHLNGSGSLYVPDQEKYIGGFKESKKHGVGTIEYADGGTYDGDWKENEFHGLGKRHFPDGSFYQGEFVDGQWHGQGSFTWSDGECYRGSFSNGIRLISLDEWNVARQIDAERIALLEVSRSHVNAVVERTVADAKEKELDLTMVAFWIFYKGALEAAAWSDSEKDLFDRIDNVAMNTPRFGMPDDYGQTLFTMTEEQLTEKYGLDPDRQEKIDQEMGQVSEFVNESISINAIMRSAEPLPVDPSFIAHTLFARGVRQTVWAGLTREETENIMSRAIAQTQE